MAPLAPLDLLVHTPVINLESKRSHTFCDVANDKIYPNSVTLPNCAERVISQLGLVPVERSIAEPV